MKKIILYLLFVIFFAGSANSRIQYPADSLGKSPGVFKNFQSEIVISFDASKLAPQNVRMVFNELFKQYLAIKDALVYNDPSNALRNTLKLIDDMKSRTKDIDILNKDDRWIFFIKNSDNIRKKAESATFISDQRFLFNEITNGMQGFLKQFGLYDKTIYFMQCETGFQAGNAKWFSDARDKKNPYLGVLKDTVCAKIKEIWKFP